MRKVLLLAALCALAVLTMATASAPTPALPDTGGFTAPLGLASVALLVAGGLLAAHIASRN